MKQNTTRTTGLPDIHTYEKGLQQCIHRIENESFSSEDKQLIKNYLKRMGAQGVSRGGSSRSLGRSSPLGGT